MAAPPTRTDLSGNPDNATGKAWLLALYDYTKSLLGATGNAAEARAALGVLSTPQTQTQAATAFPSAGTAPAYTLTADPAIGALVANQRFRVKFHSASTGAATLSVNGLAATGIKQYGSTGAKVDPTIAASQLADVEYDGTHWVVLDPLPPAASAAGIFYKKDSQSVVFTKTGAGTLDVKASTVIDVLGVTLNLAAATAVVMPALSAGTDYAIYACQDGTVRADASFTAPTGYSAANSRLIGGFHYGLVAPGTTLAGGSFNTTGSVQTGGMVWTQGDVDKIAGINQYSLWDLKWRANVSDLRAQRGFVLTDAGNWVAIYYASTDCDTNGLSKYNTNVASGSVLAKIPTIMGGNGTLTYADYNWWRASEHARAYGARLLTDAEANIAFFGVTENQSLGGAASTIPLTTRQAGYTSKYGVEQATGHHWIWGDDSSGTTAAAYVANGGRGQSYANSTTKVILSGSRGDAAFSGSRASHWDNVPAGSYWNIGLRAACDHLMLA